jgi:PTH1 family peptidyl-tRNA hydrolase
LPFFITSFFVLGKEEPKMKFVKFLIVGLGNIGQDYKGTRHNIGFETIDRLCFLTQTEMKVDKLGELGLLKHKGKQIYLLKPSTYMNLSGKAVRYWLEQLKIPVENCLIVVDELQLDFGKQRLRPKGSDGGHNGLKSINDCLNTQQYPRLRVGIGNQFSKGSQVNYVLGKWSSEEEIELISILDYAAETVLSFCTQGIKNTMDRYNQERKQKE